MDNISKELEKLKSDLLKCDKPQRILMNVAFSFNLIQKTENYGTGIRERFITSLVETTKLLVRDFKKCVDIELNEAMRSIYNSILLFDVVEKNSDGKLNIETLDLNKIKITLIRAYKCKEYPSIFNMCVARLSKICLECELFDIAKVLHMLTIDSSMVLIQIEKTDHIFFNGGIKVDTTAKISHAELLYNELQYLELMLEVSSFLLDTKFQNSFKGKQKIFKHLLNKMNVKDIYRGVPSMVKSLRDAEKVHELMVEKMRQLKNVLLKIKKCSVSMKKYEEVYNERKLYRWYVRGYLYHLMSKFQLNVKKKCVLLEKSVEIWSKNTMVVFMVSQLDVFPNIFAVEYYSRLMQTNFVNYTTIIRIRVQDILISKGDTVEDFKSEILKVNEHLKCATSQMEGYLRNMDKHKNVFVERDKVMTVAYLARLYQFFMGKTKKPLKEYLNKSIPHIRRLVQILKKDFEAREFFFDSHNDAKFAFLVEKKGESECVKAFLEIVHKDPYIKRFRRNPDDYKLKILNKH